MKLIQQAPAAIAALAVAASMVVGNDASSERAVTSSAPATAGLSSLSGSRLSGLNPGASSMIPRIFGTDNNIASNPFIQPQDPALSGGGRDQTQQGMDLLFGEQGQGSIVVGLLGPDVMIGGPYIDLMIGGPEHFSANNRDDAFGLDGDDVFLWSPGDGSDRFDGGNGIDTVIFGLIGEGPGPDPIFAVNNNQQAGEVFFDYRGLPQMDVTNSPGFCEIVDDSSSPNAAWELANIDADHLARFVIRGLRDSFNAGTQTTDNGLRVTLTLKDVEYVVCASRQGGAIEVYDLRWSPARRVPLSQLPLVTQWLVR